MLRRPFGPRAALSLPLRKEWSPVPLENFGFRVFTQPEVYYNEDCEH